MQIKKYEFTGETKNHYGVTLRQIRALVTIVGVVSSGNVGGCFTGTLEQFRKQVIETYGEASKNGSLYLDMANMIEKRLEDLTCRA